MFKGSYQCLKEIPDFGLQQENPYEFSVESWFVLKDSYQCLKYSYDFGPQ